MNIYGRVGWRTAAVAPASNIDADAQAFITAASITDSTQQSAINTLVTQLKTYGIWTKLKAVYPFVGGTASQHKFNLKDPRDLDAAYRLAFSGGWTHSNTGALPNGTTGYANTYFKPSTNGILNSHHLSYYSRTNSSINSVEIGVGLDPTYDMLQLNRLGTTTYGFINQSSLTTKFTDTNSLGLYVANRTASNIVSLWKNGINKISDTASSTSLLNGNVFIGAQNDLGLNVVNNFTTKESAFASIGDGLTDTEAANFYTAVQTFQTTLGRQVGVPIVADADAQAFLNAAVITDQTQANAVTTLVTDLKSANIWTKLKAVYPFVGGTASTHKFNLKDPRDLDVAYRLTFSGGWTHSSTGALPNGTTGYADTKLIPSFVLTLNSTHISAYSRTNNNSITPLISDIGVASNLLNIFPRYSGTNDVYMRVNSSPTSPVTTSATSTGLYVANRISSTETRNRVNSSSYVQSATSTGLTNNSLWLSRQGSGYDNREQAFASIGDGLTDTEAANFYTAVQKYQTSLSRNV
jgi:hypothetical protein